MAQGFIGFFRWRALLRSARQGSSEIVLSCVIFWLINLTCFVHPQTAASLPPLASTNAVNPPRAPCRRYVLIKYYRGCWFVRYMFLSMFFLAFGCFYALLPSKKAK